MKYVKTVIFLIFIQVNSYSQYQSDYSERFSEIVNMLKDNKLLESVLKMDEFLKSYPNSSSMYFNRGIALYRLNDVYGARKDLKRSLELGIESRHQTIKQIISKGYLLELLSKSYETDFKFDSAHGFKPIYSRKDTLRGQLSEYRSCFDVYYYNLSIKIFSKTKSIEGKNLIYFKLLNKTNKIQIDLVPEFAISNIFCNGEKVSFTREFDAVFINFSDSLDANTKNVLEISYFGKPRIAPKPPWNGGFVWKRKGGKDWIGVACEHLGSSSWWPSKDHLSDKPDSMDINIQVPSKYKVISNGNLRGTKPIGKDSTWYNWHVSYPINTYNVTFYAGNFVNFSDTIHNSFGKYPIDYYVLPKSLNKAKQYYSQTKEIVEVYEELFGEYPYKNDGMGMVEAPYEGMEHQSAIAIGDSYGKKERRGYENKKYDYLLVHETAHEWWGNTIAFADMADAWISEGFATYAEHLFMEKKLGYSEYVDATSKTIGTIFNIWPMVGNSDVNDNTFIGGDIYHKGAAMLNNLRCIINNDSIFLGLIKSFYNTYKYKVLRSVNFTEFVNNFTGKDYSDFLNKFLYDDEPPVLRFSYTKNNNRLTLNYQWINVGENFTMPFCIFINETECIRIDANTQNQKLTLNNVNSFYFPTGGKLKKELIKPNSYTYYWVQWVR